MKKKKIETHKIGLVGQAPSRRGDPRKPPAGPNGQKIARLAGMSYDELIACRRKHLNRQYQREAPQRRRVRPRERQRQSRGHPIRLARRAHRPAR